MKNLAANRRAFFGGTTQAAVAAERAHMQLFNPAASNRLALVTKIDVLPGGAASVISVRRDTTALGAAPVTPHNRYLGGTAPLCVIRPLSQAASAGTEMAVRTNITQDLRPWEGTPDDPLFVFEAGNGVTIIQETVNLPLNVWFYWIEIPTA